MLQNQISQKQIQRSEVKGSLKKASIYFVLSIPTYNPNMLNLLEMKNMKHVTILQTLELDFIAHFVSFVPSQRRSQMRKHQQNFSLWAWLPLVHLCASLCLLKKIIWRSLKYICIKKTGSAEVHNERLVIFITELCKSLFCFWKKPLVTNMWFPSQG